LRLTVVTGLSVGIGGMILLTSIGIILPWAGRFYSLWDTGEA
jgi:dolichyl-diphosphooligosaccharide--protein glycosyltransferase